MFSQIFNKVAIVIFMVLFIVLLTQLDKIIDELNYINSSIARQEFTSSSPSMPSSIDVRVTSMPSVRINDVGGIDVNAKVRNDIGSLRVTSSSW